MKLERLIDDATARAIGFAWLRAAVSPASDYGDRAFAEWQPFARGEEAAAQRSTERIGAVAAAVDMARLEAAREIFRSVPDATDAIARASMGDVLADAALLELQRFFDALDRTDALLADAPGVDRVGNEAVRVCARALELGRAGKFGFYLADAFDEALAKARGALAQAQAEYDAVRGRAVASIAKALGRDELSGNEFIVMRSDMQGALPPGVRVVRESPTYVLCELDADESTIAALARRDSAAEDVERTEEAVRARLSDVVRMHAARLDQAARAFGEADVLVAAARFARAYRCTAPSILPEAGFEISGARYLPLEETLEREGRTFTPIDVALDGVAVLTGPNMGGKTVCLETCGFVAMCAAFGLPVPADRASVGLFDEVAWLGVGIDAELGGLLSSFAREVVRLRDVLHRTQGRLFVLFDEFARTTTPHEGKALLVAVLSRLQERRASGIVATHLAGVAPAAGVRHFAVRGLRGIPNRLPARDLHEALAALADSMDYTIAEVTHERDQYSDAIALASLLGLDDALIDDAYKAL